MGNLYLMQHCHYQNDYALRWAAMSHFSVSLIGVGGGGVA